VSALFGRPRTTSDRETTPPVFIWNAPFCHAVVTLAAAARGARLPVTTSGTVTNKATAAAGSRGRRGREPGEVIRLDTRRSLEAAFAALEDDAVPKTSDVL
jgi:hypothetical protein